MGARRPSIPLILGGLALILIALSFWEVMMLEVCLGLIGLGLALSLGGLFFGPRPKATPELIPPPERAPHQPAPHPPSSPVAQPLSSPVAQPLSSPPGPSTHRPQAQGAPLPEELDTLVGAPAIDWAIEARADLFLGADATPSPSEDVSAPKNDAATALQSKLSEAERALSRREEALRETQNEVHTLEGRVEELETQLKEQGQSLFEARFREKKAREEGQRLQDETRATLRTQGKQALEEAQSRWEEERLSLQERHRALEARISQVEEERRGLESQLAGATAGADEGRRALLGELQALKVKVAALQEESLNKDNSLTQLQAEGASLKAALEELEAKGASEAASIAADRAALEAGRASLQREVESQSRELSHLKSRLKGLSGGGDPRGPLLETLEGAGVPALFIGEEGLIAGVSAPLLDLLHVKEEDILGLDTWSFTTEILAPLSPDDDALKAQQAALLEGIDHPLFDPIPLHDSGLLHRWIYPLPAGAGQMELFAIAPAAGALSLTPDLEQALDTLKQAAGLAPQPSSLTTLEALGRQLKEMGDLLPDSDGALEARARLSTAKALVRSLLGVIPAGADNNAAAAELARRILPHLERALGPRPKKPSR